MTTSNSTPPPDGGATSTTAAGSEDRGAYWEQEARKAFQARDELKARVRDLEGQTKARADEEARRAAEAGEYKTAYEKAMAKLQAQAPIVAEHEAHAAYFEEQLQAARDGMPPDFADLVPQSLSKVEQLRMIQKLSKLAAAPARPAAPPPSSPPAAAGSGPPPYGTAEYLEWQSKAPLEEVRKAREKALAAARRG